MIANRYVQWISVNKNVSFKLSTSQKVKEFFSKCDQICSFLQIWSHLLKKSLMENFLFCAVQMKIGKLNFPQNLEINFNDLQLNLSNVTVAWKCRFFQCPKYSSRKNFWQFRDRVNLLGKLNSASLQYYIIF